MAEDATCLFEVDRSLLETLDGTFGPPVDSYLTGWQVWLEPSPAGLELEYRLHPPPGFRMPEGLHPEELWDEVQGRLAAGADLLALASGPVRLEEVWELLEVYPAHGDPVSPDDLRTWAEEALGRPALACGVVDHRRLGKQWERRPGRFDLPGALREALGVPRLSEGDG